MPYMRDVGNLEKNRDYYLKTHFPNLKFLFSKRFNWMNDYIGETDEVLEVGCGIGVTKLFINKGNITLSDVVDNSWIDRQEDALNLSYEDECLDVIIANNMIHHLAHPIEFFQEANRVLKKGGRILIQEVNCSFFLQKIIRFMHIEDYNFNVNVFDVNQVCTNSQNPWDGNNAIPNLLFDDLYNFEQYVPYLKVLEKRYSEFFIYICSGGINSKSLTIPLPDITLKILDTIDNLIVLSLPKVFSLQMRIVLEKK